jgi:hypothetical protein
MSDFLDNPLEKTSRLKLNRQLRLARPRLKTIAPWTAAIVIGFAVTNMILGIGLWTYVNVSPQATFPVISGLITYKVWGVIFFALGAFKLTAYIRNDWAKIKFSLLTGLLIKSIWLYALFIRFLTGGSIILLVIWLFFAYVQIVTYIYFIPLKPKESLRGI